ncbi:MAG: hypothetical protein IH853_02515 [Bacteroidetes bacterium]|nr:hypothetical protein [Bacteroidota bacterium]
MKSVLLIASSLALGLVVLVGCSESESPMVAADTESALSKKGGKGGGKPGGEDPQPPPNPAIVFSDGNDLKVINSDGSNERVVLNNGSPVYRPVWDFKGERFAFTASSGDLWKINVDGSSPQLLMSKAGYGPAFSPDGASIVFEDCSSGNLLSIPSSGGGLYLSFAAFRIPITRPRIGPRRPIGFC